jgi:hypothetical protein
MPERKTRIVIPPDTAPTDGWDVPIVESIDRWSELTLEDGSILRVKPIIGGVVRVPGRFDTDGNPVYVLRGAITMAVVETADRLKNQNPR